MTDETETIEVPRELLADLTEYANGYGNLANADGASETAEEVSECVDEAREILE